MVEVAHEALLRKWPLLRGWLDEEREFLIGKDQLEQDLLDWEKAPAAEKTEALLSGLKLTRALPAARFASHHGRLPGSRWWPPEPSGNGTAPTNKLLRQNRAIKAVKRSANPVLAAMTRWCSPPQSTAVEHGEGAGIEFALPPRLSRLGLHPVPPGEVRTAVVSPDGTRW